MSQIATYVHAENQIVSAGNVKYLEKDYLHYYDTKSRYLRSGCNVLSCYLKIENMIYREQRLRGKCGIVWKKAVPSNQRIKEHFKIFCGDLK